MAQYWLDIHADPRSDAEILALWELINCVSGATHTMTVVTKNGLRSLSIQRGPTTSVAMARLIEAGNPSNVDVVAKIAIEDVSSAAPGGLVCRASAAVGTAQWYCGYYNGSVDVLSIQSSPTKGPTILVSASSGVTASNFHYRRLEASGTTLSQKAWAGERGDEPGSWLLTTSNETYSSGFVGIGSRGGSSVQGIVHLTQLAIGTDGDPAPTGPVGGRQRSRLILTPW